MVVCSRSLERLAIQAPAAYSMRRATRALFCALALRSAAPKPPKRAKATGRNESCTVTAATSPARWSWDMFCDASTGREDGPRSSRT